MSATEQNSSAIPSKLITILISVQIMERLKIQQILLRSMGAIMAVLALPGALIWYDVIQSLEEIKQEQQSQQIIARLADMRLLLHRAESEQRNYLISGKTVFLAQRNAALVELNMDFERLHKLTSENVEQQQRIRELHGAVNRKIAIFNLSTERYETQGYGAAQALLKNGRREQAAINKITDQTKTAEKNMLQARKFTTTPSIAEPPTAVMWMATSTIFLSHMLLSLRGKLVMWQPKIFPHLLPILSYKKFIAMWVSQQRSSQVYHKLDSPASIGST